MVYVSFTGGVEQILNPYNIVEPFVDVRVIRPPLSYNAQLPIRNLVVYSQLLSVVQKHGRLHVLEGIDGHPASQSGCQSPAPASSWLAVWGNLAPSWKIAPSELLLYCLGVAEVQLPIRFQTGEVSVAQCIGDLTRGPTIC